MKRLKYDPKLRTKWQPSPFSHSLYRRLDEITQTHTGTHICIRSCVATISKPPQASSTEISLKTSTSSKSHSRNRDPSARNLFAVFKHLFVVYSAAGCCVLCAVCYVLPLSCLFHFIPSFFLTFYTLQSPLLKFTLDNFANIFYKVNFYIENTFRFLHQLQI